jgi:hypothetical protein
VALEAIPGLYGQRFHIICNHALLKARKPMHVQRSNKTRSVMRTTKRCAAIVAQSRQQANKTSPVARG